MTLDQIDIETGEKKGSISVYALQKMAELKDRGQAMGASKVLTLIIDTFCMEQGTKEFMDISQKYKDLYVEFTGAIKKLPPVEDEKINSMNVTSTIVNETGTTRLPDSPS